MISNYSGGQLYGYKNHVIFFYFLTTIQWFEQFSQTVLTHSQPSLLNSTVQVILKFQMLGYSDGASHHESNTAMTNQVKQSNVVEWSTP